MLLPDRCCRLFALVVVLSLFVPSQAEAAGRVRGDSKIESALFLSSGEHHHTWVVDDDDILWRVHDGLGNYSWESEPLVAGYPVGPYGVTVASWEDRSGPHEWVYYVDASGSQLHQLRIDGIVTSLYTYTPPVGHTFTGRLEARAVILNRVRTIIVAATTTAAGDTRFLTCAQKTSSTKCYWVDHGGRVSPTSDIASEVWPGFDSIYFFISSGSNPRVRSYRSGTWKDWEDLGNPGAWVCDSISAISGAVWFGSPREYALHVFCTENAGATNLWTRYTNDGINWEPWLALPASVTLDPGPYTVASGWEDPRYATPTGRFVAYALEEVASADSLIEFHIEDNLYVSTLVHSPPIETDALRGGMTAATKDSNRTVRASLVGDLGEASGFASYLFEHDDRLGSSEADDWYNVGGSERRYRVSSAWPHTEGMLAEESGWTVTAMMRMLGASDTVPPGEYHAMVLLNESFDDGLSWTGEWLAPPPLTAPLGGGAWNAFMDPTIDVYDGTAYTSLLALEFTSECSQEPLIPGTAVYIASKVPGGAPASLVDLAVAPEVLDHPWMQIDEEGVAHVVWSPATTGEIHYRSVDLTTSPPDMGEVCRVHESFAPASLVLDAGGTPYVLFNPGALSICRVDTSVCPPSGTTGGLDVCLYTTNIRAQIGMPVTPDYPQGIDCSGVSTSVRIGFLSLGASAVDPGILYLALQDDEAGSTTLQDIYLAYSIDAGVSWQLRPGAVAGTLEVNDFYPQLVVTAHDTLAIGWYEQQDCPGGGVGRCATGKAIASVDGGITWYAAAETSKGDLCDLPSLCGDTAGVSRFLGDYRESVPNLLHTHLQFTVPVPPPTRGEMWSHFIAPRFF